MTLARLVRQDRRVRRASRATQATPAPQAQLGHKALRVILARLAQQAPKALLARRETQAPLARKVRRAFKATLARLALPDHKVQQAPLVPPAHKDPLASVFHLAGQQVKCWPRRQLLTTTRHGLTSPAVVVVLLTSKSSPRSAHLHGQNLPTPKWCRFLHLAAVEVVVLDGEETLERHVLEALVVEAEAAWKCGFPPQCWAALSK